jgi:hypothetical protein
VYHGKFELLKKEFNDEKTQKEWENLLRKIIILKKGFNGVKNPERI